MSFPHGVFSRAPWGTRSLVEIQPGQDWSAFLPDRIEAVRVEAQQLKDGGGDLHRLHEARDRLAVKIRVRDEQHHVGVVVRKAAVLGLLLEASGVHHAHVGYHDDVRRTRVGFAPFGHSAAGVEVLGNAGGGEHRCD